MQWTGDLVVLLVAVQRIVAVHSGVGVVVASVSRRAVSTAHGFYVNGLGKLWPWQSLGAGQEQRERIFLYLRWPNEYALEGGEALCCLQCLLGVRGGSAYGCCPDSPSGDANKVRHHVSMDECAIA